MKALAVKLLVARSQIASFAAFSFLGAKRSLAYPLEILGSFISTASYAIIYLLVMSPASNSVASDLSYWLAAQVMYVWIRYPSTSLFNADQRLERLGVLQTLPVSHFSRLLFAQLGGRLPGIIVAVLMVASFPGEDFARILLRIVMVSPIVFLAGFSLEMLSSVATASSTRTFGAGELKVKTILLLSGIIFPLHVLPLVVQNIAYMTPLPWLVYEPALFIIGEADFPWQTVYWSVPMACIAGIASQTVASKEFA